MSVAVRAETHGHHVCLVPTGPFDLAHATEVVRALERAETGLGGCRSVDVDLSSVGHIDGVGAVLLAQLLDRLDANGLSTQLVEERNPEAARLIGLYRGRGVPSPAPASTSNILVRIGAGAAELPGQIIHALDFVGQCAIAVPKALAAPSSVKWGSLPKLFQEIAADALLVTSAANLLVGMIIGFLGVSQLGRFGSVALVPELVVVSQFRELGPLVTAIIVAGRTGAGIASELATMKVSEEIDALRSLGFDPVRWLVVPRCLALVLALPLLTWIGDVVALAGGFLATMAITNLTPRAYVMATVDAITASLLFGGLLKGPFLALAIGLIACSQGLATQGGAAAVGTSTTKAVVLSILGVIVIDAVFTLFYSLLGL